MTTSVPVTEIEQLERSTTPVRSAEPQPSTRRFIPRPVLPRWAVWMLAAIGGAIFAFLAWARLSPVARDTLWAEDGKLFLVGAEQHGLLVTFTPYTGYLQVVPRIIAAAVVWFEPIGEWARAMTGASCLTAGAIAVVVFFASRAVVPPVALRLALAAVTVLLPLEPREVLGNTANLHSILMWGLLWMLLARPRTRASAVAFSVIGLFAALSEIQVVFLVPLMVFAWRRTPFGRWLVAGPALGMAAQLVTTVLSPRRAGEHLTVPPLSLAEGWVINAIMPDLASLNEVGRLLAVGGIALGLLALAGIVVLAVLAWRHATVHQRIALVGAGILSPLIYVVSVVMDPGTYYDYASMTPAQLTDVWLARYGVAPGMLVMAVVIASAAALGVGRHDSADAAPRVTRIARTTRVIGLVAVLAVVVSLVTFYEPSSTRRGAGPTWSTQIAAAIDECQDDPSLKTVDLNETLGWKVPVECGILEAEG